jgi:hypothetical protein
LVGHCANTRRILRPRAPATAKGPADRRLAMPSSTRSSPRTRRPLIRHRETDVFPHFRGSIRSGPRGV